MQLMVLSHNKNIDNNKLTIEQWKSKLQEEVAELIEAETTKDITEEVLDVLQVCIGIIDFLVEKKAVNIKAAIQKHLKKLSRRGWRAKKLIVFGVFEWMD